MTDDTQANSRGDGAISASRVFIISGGQTGVDRGALDAALDSDAPCGGWCPQGRAAEDGPIAARYPLREVPGGGYIERTRRNVADSDATLIIIFRKASGGTAGTVQFCRRLARPYLVLDAAATSLASAERLTREFVHTHGVRRLNVAGPRASEESSGYAYARALIRNLLRREP